MSNDGNIENLLIDFNNVNVNDEHTQINQAQTDLQKVLAFNNSSTKSTSQSMAFMCSSQPLYKLLQKTESDDDNNPFDHLDKQAGLLDDPFEIVENAALVSSCTKADNELFQVETGTLISIDSPIYSKPVLPLNNTNSTQTVCDTPKSCLSSNDNKNILVKEFINHETVQNTSQKQTLISPIVSQMSPSGRSKGKNTSISLLKYSLSNSRLDLATENLSPGDGDICAENVQRKKHITGMRRDSTTDDSFDDIWATKPNLIDSQNDIDVDSDIDSDIAKLSIPMLKMSMPCSNIDENSGAKMDDEQVGDCLETKVLNRNEILEKFAYIKQQFPQSPAIVNTTTTITSVPIHNKTVDIKSDEIHQSLDEEPVTPKSQFSSVQLPTTNDNTNSLIENLKKMVDQCDDKSKQIEAKHLLDDLSSILSKTDKHSNKEILKNRIEKRQPAFSQLKRQGTFSIEKDNCDAANDSNDHENTENTEHAQTTDTTNAVINTGLSEVVKQIQSAFGPHQNINVLQSNDQHMGLAGSTVNPTYIVVMAQSALDYNNDSTSHMPHRSRSQSLTLKEKPLAAVRATQQKVEQSQSTVVSTPLKRPVLQRRSSFGSIVRNNKNAELDVANKPENLNDKANVQKIRRRSLQAPTIKHPEPVTKNQLNPANQIIRRRSFQGTSPTSGIRSPSPKSNFGRGPISANTAGTLTRRKSFATDSVKDSPQKMKSSYGIMKKPPAPVAARNLKIRVTQGTSGRSTAPLRAVVPVKQVASRLLVNETVSPLEDMKSNALITSTPRSIPILSPAKFTKGKEIAINLYVF